MYLQEGNVQAAVQAQASAARAQATAAREAATAARQESHEQAREQVEMLRRQLDAMRDASQMGRDGARPIIMRPSSSRGPTPRQEKLLFSGFIIVVLAAVVIFHPLVRALARRLESRPTRPNMFDSGSAERLARIEQAIDAMAIEIERISEGQRFTTKLLSARVEAPIPLER